MGGSYSLTPIQVGNNRWRHNPQNILTRQHRKIGLTIGSLKLLNLTQVFMRLENKNALVLVPRQEQSEEEVLIQKVKGLFEVNAVHGLFVEEYYAMREEERIDLCETLLPVTLCKVPERDGIGMWFFLSKEVLV